MRFPGGSQAAILDTIISRKCNALVIELLGTGDSRHAGKSLAMKMTRCFMHLMPACFRCVFTSDQSHHVARNGIENLALVAAGEARERHSRPDPGTAEGQCVLVWIALKILRKPGIRHCGSQ